VNDNGGYGAENHAASMH